MHIPMKTNQSYLRRFAAAASVTFLAGCLAASAAYAGTEYVAKKKLPGKRTLVKNVEFVAFDTETTGFSPEKDRIVEIGAVKFKNGEVMERRTWLINPERPIPYWAKKVHGIDDTMVADQPTFPEMYAEFQEFIDGTVLIAHNARFDISFIEEELKRCGMKPPKNEVVDSLALFRRWFEDASSFSLEGLAIHLKIREGGFHRALADSMFIYWILGRGMEDQAKVKTLGNLERAAGGPMRF